MVFFGVVPGTILAASGFVGWFQHVRPSPRSVVIVLAAGAASVVGLDLMLDASPRVGLQITLFVAAVAVAAGAAGGLISRRLVLRIALSVGILGGLTVATPLVRLLPGVDEEDRFPIGTAATVTTLTIGVAVLAAGTLYAVRRRSSESVFAGAVVAGTLILGTLNTPLDWFPQLIGRWAEGKPAYSAEYSGLTSGLYEGLTWIRDSTRAGDVLVVNNHSLQPEGRDSKYFYYSAFAERRVVLESWDYTPETAARGYFSLPAELSPFPGRLAASNAVFRSGNERAARMLARDYGAGTSSTTRFTAPRLLRSRASFPSCSRMTTSTCMTSGCRGNGGAVRSKRRESLRCSDVAERCQQQSVCAAPRNGSAFSASTSNAGAVSTMQSCSLDPRRPCAGR